MESTGNGEKYIKYNFPLSIKFHFRNPLYLQLYNQFVYYKADLITSLLHILLHENTREINRNKCH
jgi:hypothetical protein